MNKIQKIFKIFKDPDYRFLKLSELGIYDNMDDEEYIRRKFKSEMGYELDLENPRTYNEKLQWIKLYDRKPMYCNLVDKYEVKDYVSKKIGSRFIIPTYGVWNHFDDIDFNQLPNQFVLKCTHDSGGLVICKDKESLDLRKAKKKIEKCLKTNFYLTGREWPYKNVQPRIIAEKYMEDAYGELRDYKFFCFNGVPKVMFIASDRQKPDEDVKFDFFDMDFNHLDISNGHPQSKILPQKPQGFEEMKYLASELSTGLREIRIDFYEINGDIYFGEMTFFQHSGFCAIKPIEWDIKMGEWIEL